MVRQYSEYEVRIIFLIITKMVLKVLSLPKKRFHSLNYFLSFQREKICRSFSQRHSIDCVFFLNGWCPGSWTGFSAGAILGAKIRFFVDCKKKKSGEGDIEETNLRLEEDVAVEDLFDEDDFDETMDRNVQVTEKENGLFEDARFSLNHQLGYRFQAPEKIVSNRSSLRLEWNSDISENLLFQFDGKGILHYADDHLTRAYDPSQEYFGDFNMREFYFQGSFGKWAYKVGRQVVIWGESDASVLDVVSPQDLREIYFTSLEDLRIAQNLARITYFSPQSEWDCKD